MLDCHFRAVLHASAAFDAGIDIRSGGFALDQFKDSGRADVNADGSAAAFVIVDVDSDIAISVLVCLHNHVVRTPTPREF